MPALLMQAAQSAAVADGVGDALQQARTAIAAAQQRNQQAVASAKPKKKGPPLRRGKWTPEEEAYAARLIQEFKAGLLPLTDGTTLRTFLSKLLNCDPMRISKKFVGSNCIGKQVFRRRTADVNRLTPEQIQQSRAELSELERRFLDRVAQTNRVKSSGCAAAAGPPPKPNVEYDLGDPASTNNNSNTVAPLPPWLQPPVGYKHGMGAALCASNLSSNSRAAAAGRALLGQAPGLLAMELQRRASQNSLSKQQQSANNLLAAAAAGSQLFKQASNVNAASSNHNVSMNSLLLKTGLSRDQLHQLAAAQQNSGANNNSNHNSSTNTLSNMMGRQNSFDALMSLDFQSLQSIDNLANLIQTTGSAGNSVPESGMKNADFVSSRFAADANQQQQRVESFLRNLSSNNVQDSSTTTNNSSSANISNLLQSMQGGDTSCSANNLLQRFNDSQVALANLLRQESSTGLSALRVQDGLNQRNSSVDDFLSLVTAGDIPHQDASLLNVPLTQQQDAAAKLLAQYNNGSSNSALANAYRSFGNLQQQQRKRGSEEAGAFYQGGPTKR